MRYAFTVADAPSETVGWAFPELAVSGVPGRRTTLYGDIRDRAQLDCLLARFGDLGLEVVDLHLLPD